jgi:CheY-like chemotaxis protein
MTFDALVIDDYPAAAKAMATLLERLCPPGWAIGSTTDAAEGLSAMIGLPHLRLVVTDYLLPRFDAQDIVEMALRARPRLRGRIIVSSGADFPPDIYERLFVDLACLPLPKPVETDLLKTYIAQIAAMPDK